MFLTILTFNVNATKYYVSSLGNDNNSGTNENSAWRSLTKVNHFYKLYPGDSVLFNRGDEWNGTLKVNSSGTEGNPIFYGAYGSGSKPKFYSSELISGEWSLHYGNIYKTSFSKLKVEQVFINNKRLKSARYPKTGYLPITTVNSPTQFTSTELNGDINYKDARIMIRDESWSLASKTVSSSTSQTINIQSATNYTLNQGEGFFLVDKLEFLTQAGEWYFDSTEKLLYIWTPDGDSPANHNIRVSLFDNGINIVSKNFVVIKDVEFLHSASDAIKISNSNFISVINNNIYLPGSTGILINEGATYASITNNIIDGANDFGIQAYGTNNTFSKNIIKNIKLLENISTKATGTHSGVGIFLENAPFSLIKNNTIENTGSAGIQFYTSPNTNIENNYIRNTMLTINDGGGIYCWSISEDDIGSENSTISGNIVENTFGNTEGTNSNIKQGHGIYIDDRVHHITVNNNTIIASSYVGIFLHNTKNIEVRENTVYDSGRGIYVTYSFNASNNNIKNNIILNSMNSISPSNEGSHLIGVNSNFTSVASIDSIRYVDKHRINPFRNDNPSTGGNLSFSQWKRITSWDANSTFDGTPLAQGESEKIFYNETMKTKKINLGSSVFKDVYGKQVSGTIKLEPFTSIILIGKDFKKINQSPSILDQSFNFVSPKTANYSIGKIFAFDPDTAQTITYSIIDGNYESWFSLDTLTGEIFTKSDIQSSKDTSVNITIRVTDNSVNFLSDSAKVTINVVGFDTSPPNITNFTIPPIYTSLTIPITSFTATDDVAVVGYILTETSNVPNPEDSGWSTTPPKTFTLSKEGNLLLYAWVKDYTGNISTSKSAPLNIGLVDMSPTYSEYLYEESEGLTIVDSKGKNNGTITNEVLRAEGVIGNGLKFTGKGYINLGQIFGQNVENGISISTWVKPNANSKKNEGLIIHGGPNGNSFALYLNPLSKSIVFETNGTTNSLLNIDNITQLWDGDWHHLLVTFNRFEKTIYLDNVVLTRTRATGKIDNGWGHNLLIGAGEDKTSTTLLFDGMIDETRIYNYGLNSDEIRELYETVNRKYASVFIKLNKESDFSGNVDIYPNPAHDIVYIRFVNLPEIDVEFLLLDFSGKLIYHKKALSKFEIINIKNFPAGVYFIKILMKNQSTTQKLIII